MIVGLMALAAFGILCLLALGGAVRANLAIRASRHQSYGNSNYAQFVYDKDELNRMGYPQLLRRRWGGVSSFGLSFNQLGLLGGTAALYGLAVQYGGMTVAGWGWLVLGLFGIAAGAAMAELCSAFPTAGGPYHWSLALGGVRWSWVAGWLYILGSAAMLMLMNFFGAQMIDDYLSSLLRYKQAEWTTIVWMALFYLIQWWFNIARSRGSGMLQSVGVWIGIGGAAALIACLAWATWPGVVPAQSIFDNSIKLTGSTDTMSSSWTDWIIGMLLLQRMFIGSEGAASGAEETADPRVRSAWSVFLAPVYVFLIGFVLLCILTVTLPLNPSWNNLSFASWLASIIGVWRGWELLLVLLLAVSIGLNGMQGMNAMSRSLFAMSRDGALPDQSRLSKVSVHTGKPSAAITAAAFISGILGAVYFGLNGSGGEGILTIAGLAIASVQAACAIPIGLRLFGGSRRELHDAPWRLGWVSTAVHWTAWIGMVGSASGCILLFGYSVGYTFLLVAALAWAASIIRGKRFESKLRLSSRRTRLELQRIERKFGPLFLDGK